MVTSKYSYKNKSSTTASGHVGTGVGLHNKTWPHYNPPQKGDQRLKHTQYDYDDATQKIASAKGTSGSVQVTAVVYAKTVGWRCGNGACDAKSTNSTLPDRKGCKVAKSGDHTWVSNNSWTAGAKTTRLLYYDKRGQKTQVSYHKF